MDPSKANVNVTPEDTQKQRAHATKTLIRAPRIISGMHTRVYDPRQHECDNEPKVRSYLKRKRARQERDLDSDPREIERGRGYLVCK